MNDEIKPHQAWNDLKATVGMDLYRAAALAEAAGHDSCTFTMINSNGGIFECKWLDAFFGAFQIEGQEGVVYVDKIGSTKLWVLSMFDKDGKQVKPETEDTPG